MDYEFKLDIFEGPLDLLLYLIKKNEIDIYNIPIAMITKQYLEYIEKMKTLNLNLAGEYLILASTLMHIKSKMLLPDQTGDTDEEELDPREDLVKQLLEYQIFKEAAICLNSRPILERDVFKKTPNYNYSPEFENEVFEELDVFELAEAFRRIISSMNDEESIDIDIEKMSLVGRINEIMGKLIEVKQLTFSDLITEKANRRMIVYTFLAVLELMKLNMIRVYQAGLFGTIRIILAVEI